MKLFTDIAEGRLAYAKMMKKLEDNKKRRMDATDFLAYSGFVIHAATSEEMQPESLPVEVVTEKSGQLAFVF